MVVDDGVFNMGNRIVDDGAFGMGTRNGRRCTSAAESPKLSQRVPMAATGLTKGDRS